MNYPFSILNIRIAQHSDVEPIVCNKIFFSDDALQYEIYENFHHTKIIGYTVYTMYLLWLLSWQLLTSPGSPLALLPVYTVKTTLVKHTHTHTHTHTLVAWLTKSSFCVAGNKPLHVMLLKTPVASSYSTYNASCVTRWSDDSRGLCSGVVQTPCDQ